MAFIPSYFALQRPRPALAWRRLKVVRQKVQTASSQAKEAVVKERSARRETREQSKGLPQSQKWTRKESKWSLRNHLEANEKEGPRLHVRTEETHSEMSSQGPRPADKGGGGHHIGTLGGRESELPAICRGQSGLACMMKWRPTGQRTQEKDRGGYQEAETNRQKESDSLAGKKTKEPQKQLQRVLWEEWAPLRRLKVQREKEKTLLRIRNLQHSQARMSGEREKVAERVAAMGSRTIGQTKKGKNLNHRGIAQRDGEILARVVGN